MTTSIINYQQLQQTAYDLISSLGTSYKLIRPSINGDQVIASSVPGTFDKQVAATFSSTGGGVVISGKNVIYLPVIKSDKAFPMVEDRLIQGSYGWRIIEVDVLRPDGATTILYTCTVS